MNKFFHVLFSTAERTVVTVVVIVAFLWTVIVPGVAKYVQVNFNEDFAVGLSDAEYCRNTYQVRASRCNSDPRCAWDYNNTYCVARGTGGGPAVTPPAGGSGTCAGRLQWKANEAGSACTKTAGCTWDNPSGQCISSSTTKAPAPTPMPGGTTTEQPLSGTQYDAALISQDVPTSMVSGQTYRGSITIKNTGTEKWYQLHCNFKLDNPFSYNDTNYGGGIYASFGIVNVCLVRDVAPGETYTFPLNMTAPALPLFTNQKTYNFQWQMQMPDPANQWNKINFGEPSRLVQIRVTKP